MRSTFYYLAGSTRESPGGGGGSSNDPVPVADVTGSGIEIVSPQPGTRRGKSRDMRPYTSVAFHPANRQWPAAAGQLRRLSAYRGVHFAER